MAAGDKITATLKTITSYDTIQSLAAALTANAATSDTDGLKQDYDIVPTKANGKGILLCSGIGAAADGDITYSIAVGANGMAAVAAATGTIVKNTMAAIQLDARYVKADGKITVTFTPAGTDKLVTNHSFTCVYIELA